MLYNFKNIAQIIRICEDYNIGDDVIGRAIFEGKGLKPSGKSIQQTGIDPDILVEQSEIKSIEDNSQARKESDLRKAIKNEQINDSDNEDEEKENNNVKSDDYQLSRALDLIYALSINIDNTN